MVAEHVVRDAKKCSCINNIEKASGCTVGKRIVAWMQAEDIPRICPVGEVVDGGPEEVASPLLGEWVGVWTCYRCGGLVSMSC